VSIRSVGAACDILDGLASEGFSVVMTLGAAGDREALGLLPPSTRVERYVPQDAVLPHCTAVVSHAGSGTTLGALADGLPQVFLPQGADQFINARRCEEAHLGRRIMPGAISADAVRGAVREVVDNTGYARNAQAVQTEMRSALCLDDTVALFRQECDGRALAGPQPAASQLRLMP